MKSNKKNDDSKDNKENLSISDLSSVRDKPMFYTQIAIILISVGTLLVIAYQMTVQSRAWVTVKGAEIIELKEGKPVTAKIIFRNSGQTPALDVTIRSNINIFGQSLPDPMPYIGYTGLTSRTVIGPDIEVGSIITKKEILTTQEAQAILHRKAAIYVYGRVDYRDIFNYKRFTEYCMVNKAGTLNFDACEKNNVAK